MRLRHLVLVKNWCCSNCGWTFKSEDGPVGDSLAEMAVAFRQKLNAAFSSHRCEDFKKSEH